MKYKNYYQILGVKRDATEAEIKKAYRKLAHKHHPDISTDAGGEEKFKEIAEAYATLKDPEKRAEYDRLGTRRAGEDFAPPPDWQQHFGGGGASFFDDVDLGDILNAFKGGGRRGTASGRWQGDFSGPGQDYEVPVTVTLEQVYHGSEVDVRLEIPEVDQYGLTHRVPRTFRIKVPKGASNGQRLRLPEKGGKGRGRGKAGDLYVVLALAPHPIFKVNGHDLTMELPLTPWEAVLGTKVEIPTLGGTVELNVKAGATAQQRFRLAKRGLPARDGHGDLYAVVRIEVPKTVTARERELFEKLAAESDFNPRKHLIEDMREDMRREGARR